MEVGDVEAQRQRFGASSFESVISLEGLRVLQGASSPPAARPQPAPTFRLRRLRVITN